jgi:hypothetical protein
MLLWSALVVALAASRSPAQAVAPVAAAAGPWTLTTPHMSITFGADGIVTAVIDSARGRNLAANTTGAGRPSLISVVSTGGAVADLGTGKPAVTAPTKVSYDEAKRVITATFPDGTVVPVSVEIADEMIVLVVLAAGAHLTKVSAVVFGAIGVDIASAAAEPVAAFDDQFVSS